MVDKHKVRELLDCLRQNYNIQKIGVSIYDMNDLENSNLIFMPDIIQIPLNPFNQRFNNNCFKSFVNDNNVEIHARSLFLQGILLSDTLPKILEPLGPSWLEFQRSIARYPSLLHALLQWAFNFDWIEAWVLGVSSKNNLEDIKVARHTRRDTSLEFQPVNHLLVDPRNWKLL